MSDEHKSPLEHTLDICVFAPLGFALEARSLLPKFIDRGRNQIVLARVVGKYAVRKGSVAAESRLVQAQEQAMSLLRVTGLTPADEPSGNGHHAGDASADAAADVQAGPASEATPTAAPAPSRPKPPFDPDTLAIPDYDSLSASQVVPRLESLATEELEAVRQYEAATRARKTILNKIVQLQSA